MSGNVSGGRKARETNKKLYGKDYYTRLGRMGGSTPTTTPKGFAADREKARLAGQKGGRSGVIMTPEVKSEIRRLFASGMNGSQIAGRIGVNHTTVYKYLGEIS